MRVAGGPPACKEWIEIGGRTLLARVVDAVAPATGRVIVVAAPGRPLPPLGHAVEIVRDSAPGGGPLAAILDGLLRIAAIHPGPGSDPLVFISSCDVPLLAPAVVRLLLGRAADTGALWTLPEVGGHPQVLCSVVRPRLSGAVERWLATGRRDPRGLVAALTRESPAAVCIVTEADIVTVDPTLASFRDVDTPADRAEIGRQLGYGDQAGSTYTAPP